MNRLIATLFLAVLFATPAQAVDVNAATCSRADVNTAVGTAVDGDRVLIPACAPTTWTSGISVTNKGITIQGAGAGSTTIVNGTAGGLLFLIGLQAADPIFILTGITFDGNSLDTGSQALVDITYPSTGTNTRIFRIHHIEFKNLRGTAITVNENGAAGSSLIDNNTFQVVLGAGDKAIRVFGAGGANYNSFTHAFALGTDTFVFIEDNTFTYSAPEDGSVDSFNGSRIVFRHNTITNTDFGNHGADSGGYRGQHSLEIYSNTFNKVAGVANSRALLFRSGSGVVYSNTWTGNYSGPEVANYRSRPQTFAPWGACDGTSAWDENQGGALNGYACLDQVGHVFTNTTGGVNVLHGLYYWSNTLNGVAITSVGVTEASMANHLLSGRDFFPNTTKPGYTAYTYPHPLQGASPPTPPAAPSALSCVTFSSSRIDCTWTDNSTDEANFELQRCTGAACSSFALIASPVINATSYSNTGLAPSTLYRYQIRAVNVAGNSAYSSISQDTTSASPPAATFYVDNSGSPACSDTAGQAGSEAAPFCTLSYASTRMAAGDTMLVKTGTYANPGVLLQSFAGDANTITTIKNFTGATVTIQGAGINTGRVRINASNYVVFEGFTITLVNQCLFVDGSTQVTIRSITCHEIGQEAIHILNNSANVTVENSTVYNTGQYLSLNGEGIYVGTGSGGPLDNTNNVIIRNNTVHDTTDEGIELKPGTHDCTVEKNTLYNILHDSGNTVGSIEINEAVAGVQTWASNPAHLIRNNIVRNSRTGIRLGTGSTAYNNLVYALTAGHYGIYVNNNASDAYTRTIYHNTLDTTAANAVVVAAGTADSKNNIGPSTTNNLATSDTFYVAKAQGNYQLVVGTAPVNAGLDLTATVPTDIIGVSRILQAPPDLGAYEYEPIAQGGGGGIATVSQTEISTPWVSVRPGVANPRNITLTNTGSAVLNIASIAISGNTTNFTQSNNCGATLAADVSCTITITFVAHKATTVTQGVLTVNTDALDPTVTLDGTGITIPSTSKPGAD